MLKKQKTSTPDLPLAPPAATRPTREAPSPLRPIGGAGGMTPDLPAPLPSTSRAPVERPVSGGPSPLPIAPLPAPVMRDVQVRPPQRAPHVELSQFPSRSAKFVRDLSRHQPFNAAQKELAHRVAVRRGTPDPNNAGIFNGAFTGFVAGVNQARPITESVSSDYTALNTQAQAFALAVDSLIPPDGSLTQAKVDLVTGICANVIALKYPTNLAESAFLTEAGAIAALYTETATTLLPFGGGGSAAPNMFIFRPGGVATGNVYTTAAEIATALDAVNGAANVYVDDSLAPAIIPNGVTWNCHGCAALYSVSSRFASLEVQNGGQILDPGIMGIGLTITCDSTTVPSIQFSDWSSEPTIILDDAVIQLGAGATLAPIQVPDAATLFFVMTTASEVLNAAADTVPIIALTGTASVQTVMIALTAPAGSAPGVAYPPNMVTGGAGSSWTFQGDGSAFPAALSFAGFSGTFDIQNIDQVPWNENTAGLIAARSVSSVNEPASIVGADGSASAGLGAVAFGHGLATATFAAAFGLGTNSEAESAFAVAGSTVVGSFSFGTTAADVAGDNSCGIGAVTIENASEFAIGQNGGPLIDLNSDGGGTITITCGASGGLFLEEIATQTTVGTAGTASALPAQPEGYLIIGDLNGDGAVVIPYYKKGSGP